MAFQKFKYTVQHIEEHFVVPKPPDHSDYFCSIKNEWDDEGNMLSYNAELSFEKEGSKHLVQGLFYYFVPLGQDFFDPNYVMVELLCQTYCRLAGFVYSKYGSAVRFLPTVERLYSEFDSSNIKPLQ